MVSNALLDSLRRTISLISRLGKVLGKGANHATLDIPGSDLIGIILCGTFQLHGHRNIALVFRLLAANLTPQFSTRNWDQLYPIRSQLCLRRLLCRLAYPKSRSAVDLGCRRCSGTWFQSLTRNNAHQTNILGANLPSYGSWWLLS